MGIIKLSVAAVDHFADGCEFGAVGPYVRIHGIAKGELDPGAPENGAIVDFERAQRNARGMVEYEVDFFILRPAEPRQGSRVLVYDVTNRGRKVILGRLDEAEGNADTNNPRSLILRQVFFIPSDRRSRLRIGPSVVGGVPGGFIV